MLTATGDKKLWRAISSHFSHVFSEEIYPSCFDLPEIHLPFEICGSASETIFPLYCCSSHFKLALRHIHLRLEHTANSCNILTQLRVHFLIHFLLRIPNSSMLYILNCSRSKWKALSHLFTSLTHISQSLFLPFGISTAMSSLLSSFFSFCN